MAGNASSEQYYLAGRAQLALATHLLESPGGDGKGANDAYVAAANNFAHAIQGNETDYRALYRYWQIRTRNGEAPDRNLQEVLVRAYYLAPQVLEIAMSTGVMLLGVNRGAEARVILNAIAGNPHGAKVSARAQRLLALIDAAPHGRAPTATEILLALAEPAAPTAANKPPVPPLPPAPPAPPAPDPPEG